MRTDSCLCSVFLRGVCGALLLFVVAVFAADQQLWPIVMVEKGVARQWSVTVNDEMRFGDNGTDFYFNRFDTGILYRGASRFDLAAGYKQVYKKSAGHWLRSHVPMVDLWVYGRSRPVQATWQMKWEYQMPEGCDAYLINRHKLTLASGRKFTARQIQPFVAAELFYDFQKRDISTRRLSIGFFLQPLNLQLRLAPQYLLNQMRNGSGWQTFHVLLIYFKFYM